MNADSADPDEVPATRDRRPQFRIGSLMIAVAVAALLFHIAIGSGGIVTTIVLFLAARFIVGWRAKIRPAGDQGLVIMGVDEYEFGKAMTYAVFVLVVVLIME